MSELSVLSHLVQCYSVPVVHDVTLQAIDLESKWLVYPNKLDDCHTPSVWRDSLMYCNLIMLEPGTAVVLLI